MTSKQMTTAVIGLGEMGGRVAAAIAATGRPVAGFDPAQSARDAAAAAGVDVVATARDAVQSADVVVLSLPLPAHVAAFATENAGHCRSDALVVDLSTIDPETARTAAAALSPGAEYVDAPVLGRPDKCGVWTLAAGGPAGAVARVRELLEGPVARAVVHVGSVGAGSTVKLLNNLMFGAINTATAEALTTCAAAGVDPRAFVRTLDESDSAAMSNLFRELAPKMLDADFTPTFGLRLLHKDNRLAVALSEQLGCPTFIGSAVHQVNGLALAAGYGAEDTGAVHKLYGSLCPPTGSARKGGTDR